MSKTIRGGQRKPDDAVRDFRSENRSNPRWRVSFSGQFPSKHAIVPELPCDGRKPLVSFATLYQRTPLSGARKRAGPEAVHTQGTGMVGTFRPRRLATVALLGALALGLAACGGTYPNSTFNLNSEYNAAIDELWDRLLFLGTAVFIVVEAGLVYTIFRYRRRPGAGIPKQVHGNTALEIAWTAIPAVILIFVAIPTVRTIFKTQAKAAPDALQVEVIGHQWWWEFKYPQLGITTANELYLPNGRTVNFQLKTYDVLHSFWIPQMGGKRDLITNHVNYLWFTPDSVGEGAWNGFCAEFCGMSHANMHFKVFTVTAANFDSWTKHQLSPAAFGAVAMTPAPAVVTPVDTAKRRLAQTPQSVPGPAELSTSPTGGPATASVPPAAASVQQAGFADFPRAKIPAHVMPRTPLPAGLTFNASLTGDPQRGLDFMTKQMGGGCIGCHAISGNPMMQAKVGPNLTHFAGRTTLAGGIYPNDTKHLTLWLKNARRMKPGVIMPTLGAGEYDPVAKMFIPKTGLNDQQIADIAAYLQALK